MMRGAIVVSVSVVVAAAMGLAGSTGGCDATTVVLHRDNCNVCHTPLDHEGVPGGLEEAHAAFPLTCVDCHGGNPRICDGEIRGAECSTGWVYDMDRAHVDPNGSPVFIKNLSSAQLDAVDPDYLRFINPGDYRIVDQTCGGGALGSPCHSDVVQTARRSTMAHTAGEVAVARFRAGKQDEPRAIFGGIAITDPNPTGEACSVESIDLYDPTPIDVASASPDDRPDVANAQDQYMVKSCFRCHLHTFGDNKDAGDFRSSGCTACHMVYADDGFSQSADPTINKQSVPHPIKHELTLSPPVEQCVHCHYRGGRIGISYQGYREAPGPLGYRPEFPEGLGISLHAHEDSFYITDEDTRNDYDETPPDLHFEAGMHCVDCHTLRDVHGDGHLYGDTQCAVSSECEDCHGTVRDYAVPSSDRNNLFTRDGKLFLRTKVTNLELEVPQTRDSITPGNPHYNANAELAMGIDANGFSHTDDMECYTCHAGWVPTCYGCHVTVDMTAFQSYDTTGEEHPGRVAGTRSWVSLFDLVLIRNTDGKIAPSMPAERFFMTLQTVNTEFTGQPGESPKKTLIANSPRAFTFEDGRTIAGFGQRAFNPHTTRRRSQFMACVRCHTVGDPANPENTILLDITHGYGSQRYPFEACDVSNTDPSCDPETDVTTYQLDQLQTKAHEPLVVVGHPDPLESRILNAEEIQRMRDVVVTRDGSEIGITTSIPADGLTNPAWPSYQRVD